MKVALMSILPAHPKLLLLDEPFSGLDVETRAQLSFLLKTLSKEGDLTTMITTHDVEEVEGFASRLCLLKKGKLDLDVELSIFMNSYRILKRPVSMMESEHSSLLESAVGWPIDDSNVSWMLKDFNADLMSEIMTADDRFEENHFQKATLRDILTFRAVVK